MLNISETNQDEEVFAGLFYEKVFNRAPFVRQLFKSNMVEQGRLLTHMLGGIVYSLSRPNNLKLGLQKLGENHRKYGVIDDYYPVVNDVMLETIQEIMGEYCNDSILKAWETALDFIIENMTSANYVKKKMAIAS